MAFAKAVAEANNCVGDMRDVLRASLVRCSARSLDCLHWALSAPSIKSMELDAFRSDLSTNWRENIMKAFIVDHYGSNDGVRAGEMPDPELRDDDVLVEIHAASVNPLDFKIRDGKLKLILPYRLPFILGNDLAGVVVRVGSRVRRFKPGDEVYARTDKDRIGSFAEFISIKEDAVAIKPKKLTMEEAASIPSGRFDRLASTDRKSEPEERAKSSHPCRLWRCRNICNSAGEASWCDRSYDNEHGESRLGEAPRCRYCHRLQERTISKQSYMITMSFLILWVEWRSKNLYEC